MNDLDMRVNIAKNLLQTSAQFSDGPSAIWEYTSNSLEYRESPLNCKIDIQIDKNQIIISDNSDGMDQEILKYFFTVSGENQARKGKQKSWMKRGQFGTGKLAAFGIANELQVETVKDGLKNIYFLSRQMIEETPEHENKIKLKKIAQNEQTTDPNGTKIYINDLNIKINKNEVIRKIEREIAHLRDYEIQILINDYLCEIKPLDITRDYIFTTEGPIRDRYGEFDLQIEVSRVPLDKYDQGIKIFCNENIIAIDGCGVVEKECGNQLTGKINIPALEEPINNIFAFDQTRSQKLNMNHLGAKELLLFISPKLEKVRKIILDEKNIARNSAKSQKLTQISEELSKKLNKEWADLKRKINEIRLESNSINADSIFNEPGDDDEAESIIFGDEFPVSDGTEIRVGDENDISVSPSDPPDIDLEEDNSGKKQGKKSPGKKSKRARGGFLVDHENRGEEEQRSLYDKANLKIIINIDHPSVVSCLKSCGDDVENINFKRLYYEIAFREFEHSFAQELIYENSQYQAEDLLFEMRALYDRVTRSLGPSLYSIS
jgi:hypothetical protein